MGGTTRRVLRVLALLLVLAPLGGCGVLFIARQGTKLFNEISERNHTLETQRTTLRASLWPELQARCRATPDVLPAAPLSHAQAVFDPSVLALLRDDQIAALPVASASRQPVITPRPEGVDAFVLLVRSVLRNDPALSLTAFTLRAEDRAGRLLGRQTQFAVDWPGQTRTEYHPCSELLAGNTVPTSGAAQPDLTLLGRLFGPR
jgi:hypothetical protein